MKLAALYTIWNGLELMNKSLSQIINDVDEVVIGWQYTSNRGEISQEIESFLDQFEENSKIHLVEFVPTKGVSTKKNELDKHNLLINKARDLNCSHFLLLATDHFYETDQFKRAKNLIIERGYEVTFSDLFTYYKEPTWRLDPPESYSFPFICKIGNRTRFEMSRNYPLVIDPSCKIFPIKIFKHFKKDDLVLHHFSMIRNDIRNKFNNAAASIRWTDEQKKTFVNEYESAKEGDPISYFGGRILKKVENIFDI